MIVSGKVPSSPERRRLAGRLAIASRRTPELVEDLRRDLKAQALEDHIRALVDTAPPLTGEQRERLAALLLSGDYA